MNLKLVLEYDGTDFHGWQIQPNCRSVQGVVEEKLGQMLGEPIRLIGAGRTDAGVHAVGQVANFHTEVSIAPRDIQRGLNRFVPKDVVVRAAESVSDRFHARFDAWSRIYTYRITTRRRAVGGKYAWFVPYRMNAARMGRAAEAFVGRRCFASFCNDASERPGYTCDVKSCSLAVHGEDLIFEVNSNRFLRGMVRTMVGTLVDVGRGKLDETEVMDILEARDRRSSGLTAPAQGLCLIKVCYDSESDMPFQSDEQEVPPT